MTSALPTDQTERLLWSILAKLETLALAQYDRCVPPLATPAKRTFAARIGSIQSNEVTSNTSALADATNALVEVARGPDAIAVLSIQGLVLEPLGQTIYSLLRDNAAASSATREWADAGSKACAEVVALFPELLTTQLADPEERFGRFVHWSKPVLERLAQLGERLDDAFGERFGLRFDEVLAEFTAELIPTCESVGMNRRKVVCHLTAAFMSSTA